MIINITRSGCFLTANRLASGCNIHVFLGIQPNLHCSWKKKSSSHFFVSIVLVFLVPLIISLIRKLTILVWREHPMHWRLLFGSRPHAPPIFFGGWGVGYFLLANTKVDESSPFTPFYAETSLYCRLNGTWLLHTLKRSTACFVWLTCIVGTQLLHFLQFCSWIWVIKIFLPLAKYRAQFPDDCVDSWRRRIAMCQGRCRTPAFWLCLDNCRRGNQGNDHKSGGRWQWHRRIQTNGTGVEKSFISPALSELWLQWCQFW